MNQADSVRKIGDLTVDEIIRLHDEILEKTGGESGILNRSHLDFVVDFIQHQVFSLKIDDLFSLAALIIRNVVQGHPFVDGNKRTGFEAASLFLEKNGYCLTMDVDDGIEFTLSVAKDEVDLDYIRDWLKEHSQKSKYTTRPHRYFIGETMAEKAKKENLEISKESEELIKAIIKRDKKFLQELAKY